MYTQKLMRLFIAINFSSKTLSMLLTLRDDLQAKSKRGHFSEPANLHLTLAFLGDCDVKQTAALKAIMNDLSFQPFNIELDHMGRFKRSGGDIWWVGVRENKPLMALQSSLTDKLTETGFAPDTRRYNPHITLGREVVTDEKERKLTPFGDTVKAIDLMLSERIRGRLTYSVIYTKVR